MLLRFRRFRGLYKVLPQIYSGHHYELSGRNLNLITWNLNILSPACANIIGSFEERGRHTQRFSTVSENFHEPLPHINFLSFIESTLDEPEGPCHRWLNKVEDSKGFYQRDGVFLVVAVAFIKDVSMSGCGPVIMFEKIKALQQRYPSLKVFGFQSSNSIHSGAVDTYIAQMTMKDYITFPILLSNKNFAEMAEGPCYIIFKDFKSPLILHEKDADLMIINKVIKELTVQQKEKPMLENKFKSSWVKPVEVFKEPHLCSSLQNLLLYLPGCIAADESGNRLFLSDINHHRIIVFDSNGNILDCIGSSPGFEDGEFECARLMCPAASFYHAAEDCLYFVDSENHSIRRADMERRVLETLYPTGNSDKRSNSLWSWIMDKLWTKVDVTANTLEFNSESFLFPWHLMKSVENNFYILNRSFETLWIMDMSSGEIKEVVKGFPKILEICGQMILDKSSILKQIPSDWLQKLGGTNCLLEGIPYAGLMSSVASFQDHIVVCDAAGQMVLKLNRKSGIMSSFQFSNFGILGLPYWLSFSLERVYTVGEVLLGVHTDHVQHFSLLPGRINIQLNIDIPEDIELVEPLQEGCIWRQARGAATEVFGAESKAGSTEKVGVAQQWYDVLDNLAFSTPEVELIAEEANRTYPKNGQVGVCIKCAVNSSPGTSEVIVNAALYLRLKGSPNSRKNSPQKKAARIADILNPKSGRGRREGCIHLLLTSSRDLEELIFMRPLLVRLKFDCRDHPKAPDNSKEIILSESSIDVKVDLN